MSFFIGPNLPLNVVEIGQELSQAKLDELNAGVLATQSWVSASYLTSSSASTTYAPKASPTFTGTVTIPSGASISGYLTTSAAGSTYQTISGMSSYLTTSAASTTYAPKASPTFTGTVTIPAGASISGYLTTANASSLYQTLSGMSSYLTTANAQNAFANKTDATGNYGVVYEAPSNGNEYVRKNATWAVATGGSGGGLTISTLSNAAASTLNATAPTTGQALTFNGTELAWATVGGSGGITDAPADGVTYGRLDGAWTSLSSYATQTWVTNQNYLPAKTVQTCPSTLGAGDQNKINHFVPAMGGATITIPADSTYAFPNGTEIVIVSDYSAGGTSSIAGQYAGQPTINGLYNVTMSANVSKLVKIGTDVWFYT